MPFLALGVVCWQRGTACCTGTTSWSSLIMYVLTGARDHGRLPPPLHPPLLQDQAARARRCSRSWARPRSRARSSPGSPTTASTMRSPTVEGDPHSPHVGHGHGLRGALRGLLHAHVGWLFIHTQRGAKARYAPDLLRRPGRSASSTARSALGRCRPRVAVRPRLADRRHARRRADRPAVGRRGADARPAPRDVLDQLAVPLLRPPPLRDRRRVAQPAWLAPLSFGESWHNNHHAFPTSAHHGMRWWERALDPSAIVIAGLERVGLATDVVRVSPGAPGDAAPAA